MGPERGPHWQIFHIKSGFLGFDPKKLKFFVICVVRPRQTSFYECDAGLCGQGSRPPVWFDRNRRSFEAGGMTGPSSFFVDDLVIEAGHLLKASAGRMVLHCDPVSRWRGMGAAIGLAERPTGSFRAGAADRRVARSA